MCDLSQPHCTGAFGVDLPEKPVIFRGKARMMRAMVQTRRVRIFAPFFVEDKRDPVRAMEIALVPACDLSPRGGLPSVWRTNESF